MVAFNTVRVNQLAWYEDNEFELQFPSSWDVTACYMKGYSAPALSEEQLKQAFVNPIGTPRIRELAKGKKEVVILFDDLTRPTKVFQLVPYILQELEEAGIPDENIRFISTLGAHGAMKRMDFAKKLGEEIVSRFAIYNHNCYDNCTYLGQTSSGTPVHINSEVMACDLKIAVGGIITHSRGGFGGGAKAVVPGVSAMETICANHLNVGAGPPTPENPAGKRHPSVRKGNVDDNLARLDMEEVARMIGLDIIVNVVMNGKRDPVGLFVGDLVAAHREGAKLAREIYATKPVSNVDIVVLNVYSKSNEANLFGFTGSGWFKEGGGSLVLISNTPEGWVTHYLAGAFGKTIGGPRWLPSSSPLPPSINKVIVFAPYPEQTLKKRLGPPQSVVLAKTWLEVIEELREDYPGRAKVAVIPDGVMELFPD
ncbi:lactate racemase domain-containing protein [Chloroflexota bacterium]